MSDKAGNSRLIAIFAPMGLAVALAAAPIQAEEGYLTNPDEAGIKTGYGECWNAVGGITTAEDCGQPELDSDGDGVPDSKDECPNTPEGVEVDEVGCPLDSDGDGVPDYLDKCPGTPAGAKVDANGCEIMGNVSINVTTDHFDFDSAQLKPAMMAALDDVAAKVAASAGNETLEIVGHTDSTGTESYNQGLSERRAQAATDYLASQGIDPSMMIVKGMGERSPVADNGTRDGRAMNRRVDILTR